MIPNQNADVNDQEPRGLSMVLSLFHAGDPNHRDHARLRQGSYRVSLLRAGPLIVSGYWTR
jgi:hypothetical protein